jgi:hypothetical protein
MIDKILYKLCSEPVKFMLTKMKEEPETGSARYMPLMPKKNSKYYSLVERIALNRAITPIHRAEMAKAIYDILMKPVNDGWAADEAGVAQDNLSLSQHLNNLVAKNMAENMVKTKYATMPNGIFSQTPIGSIGGLSSGISSGLGGAIGTGKPNKGPLGGMGPL